MRAFNPGDMVHGFRDGIDLGDITGTLSGGLEAWVKGGRVYFRAENRMNPVSFGGGNLLPAQQAWIDMPGDGPLSQIVIHYEWSSPIPQYLRPKE